LGICEKLLIGEMVEDTVGDQLLTCDLKLELSQTELRQIRHPNKGRKQKLKLFIWEGCDVGHRRKARYQMLKQKHENSNALEDISTVIESQQK
jgi:hypothetical protein